MFIKNLASPLICWGCGVAWIILSGLGQKAESQTTPVQNDLFKKKLNQKQNGH